MASFPLLSSVLSERRAKQLASTVEVLEKAVENGAIPNSVFNDCKSDVARILDDGWNSLVREPFFYAGKYKELGEDLEKVLEINRSAIHIAKQAAKVAAGAKKINKEDHPAVKAAMSYFTEAVPLAALLLKAKELIVKRVPKAPEPTAKERYSAPSSNTEETNMVKGILEQIAEDSRGQLKASLKQRYIRYVTTFEEAQEKANEEGKSLLPYSMWRNTASRRVNMDAYEVTSACMEEKSVDGKRVAVRRPNWEQAIDAKVDSTTKEIEESFVFKNLGKLSSIISKKGAPTKAKVLGHEAHVGLNGRILFEFSDGSSFVVQNSTVLSFSVHGTPFLRYPLTFHRVVMPDGSKMGQPSEERMNTVWLAQ